MGAALKLGDVYEAMMALDEALARHNLGSLRSIGVEGRALHVMSTAAFPAVTGIVDRLVVALPYGPCAVRAEDEPRWKP